MVTINLSFSERMASAALSGQKCCTTRLSKKGDPGDWFDIDGKTFRILDVRPVPLWSVRDTLYRLEGCTSPDDFECLWRSLHDGNYPALRVCYVHFFVRFPISDEIIEAEAPAISDFEPTPRLARIPIRQSLSDVALGRPPCKAQINLMLQDDRSIGIGQYTGGFPSVPQFPVSSLQNALQVIDGMGVRDVNVVLSAPHEKNGSRCLVFRLGDTPTVIAVTSFIPIDETDEGEENDGGDEE